jgi:hypothetical protein
LNETQKYFFFQTNVTNHFPSARLTYKTSCNDKAFVTLHIQADVQNFQHLLLARVRNEHQLLHTELERKERDSRQAGIAASALV